jgi:hypothetical protein
MIAFATPIELDEQEQEAPLFTDLSPFLDGTLKQEVPSVAEAFNGKHIFYAGRLNEIHAEPATGKTNVLVAATIAVIESGGSVLYIDPEDTPRGFTARLLALGASPDDIRDRVKYLHNPTPEEIQSAQAWAVENKPQMVILDGLAESMAAQGVNEDKAVEVLPFLRENLRPFAEAGAAVVIADHVTKSAEGRGQFARGSGAKAGRYDGVSYEIVMGEAYTPSVKGFVKLKVQKDRNGGTGPRGMIYAELHFSPSINGKTITAFLEPAKKHEGPFRPTAIMEKIFSHLEVHKEATATDLRCLGGKTEYINMAIALLKEDKVIDTRKDGTKVIHFLKVKEETR